MNTEYKYKLIFIWLSNELHWSSKKSWNHFSFILLKLDLCVEILQKLFSEVLYTMCATGDFQRENCSSLHLTQEFSRLYPGARNVPILSRESAPGIIMATGIIGQNLKDRPDVYVSSSAGYQWRPVGSQMLPIIYELTFPKVVKQIIPFWFSDRVKQYRSWKWNLTLNYCHNNQSIHIKIVKFIRWSN